VDHQDAFWVERARRGDHAAFGLLVDKYAAGVARLLASKTGHTDEAHDVAQDTWLHTYLSLDLLREPGKFREWVYAIARNRALMWLRQAHAAVPGGEQTLDEQAAQDASSDDVIALWELREAVLHAIAQLSDVNREAVQLHYLHDLSYGEIAERLGVPVKTVKSRLHKARQQLKPHLEAIVEPSTTTTKEEATMTEATIYDVYLLKRANNEEAHTVVVLKAQEERYLPIWVGQPEAEGIAARLRSLTTKRPLTYDLMAQLVDQLGATVEAVHLQTLRDEVFYATLHIRLNGTTTQLDCRPSDALALAIRTHASILIADAVLAQAGIDNPTNFVTSPGAPPIESIQPLQLELFKHGGSGTYCIYEQGT
jgi:RNA polymerase sigma factor (sigma-70 family)